jgi:hypothetical protein
MGSKGYREILGRVVALLSKMVMPAMLREGAAPDQ